MLSIDEIKKIKKEYGYTNAQLSELSGVPVATVQKVMSNVTKSPRYETLAALSAVFEKNIIYSYDNLESDNNPSDSDYLILREPMPAYNVIRPSFTEYNVHEYSRQGTYTIDDYLALPDEQRVELIDGVIYDIGAPTIPHQLLGGFIHAQLLDFIKGKKGPCLPLIAPTDVQLDRDNRTMVQPDVLIVCDRSKINRKRIFGAPDFAVEVLSPSTRKKDIFLKSKKYLEAGVREYWLVDPDKETIMVFLYKEDDIEISHYTFEDKVPVAIYDGKCKVDFKIIKEQYAFLDEN